MSLQRLVLARMLDCLDSLHVFGFWQSMPARPSNGLGVLRDWFEVIGSG